MAEAAQARIVDTRTFWTAIGARAVGAAVVTASDADGPAGFLALSPTHLSADPPMMMVSIAQQTSALKTIQNARHFAINYLPFGAGELAATFGGRGPLKGKNRFEPGRWGNLTTGAPAYLDAVGVLDCLLDEMIERHGAVIALGRLVDYAANVSTGPLISYRGKYLRGVE